MAVTLEELQIRFTAQMGNLNSQLNGVKKQLGGVTASAGKASTAMAGLAKMAKLFVGVYLVRGMVKIGKESLKMANDVVESEQLFGVSMKGMADSAREWSDELSASLGLNAYGLRKNVGIFNTMFTSMGLSTNKAYEMSTGLVELAEDMASFYNMDSEEAFTKLRAGITGETEPLKRLGIMVDENTTKQYALSEGISQTGKDMSQTEKLMARYAAIMGQTADAQGDLARTINSPVNQIRILGNTLDMAKIALGQAFQPIQAIVLPLLNSLAQAALSAANALKTFMWALTGFTGIGANAGAIAGAGADANEDLTDSLNDSAKAYKAAGGAAKKAAKDANVGLKAFDEINKLSEEEAEKLGGGGTGLGEIPEIIEPEQNELLETFNTYMSEAADWLKKVWEIAEPTRVALSRLWDAIKEYAEVVVWGNIVDFYEKFLKPIGEWTLTKGAPAFLDMLTSALGALQKIWEASRPVWERFYNDFLVPIGKWTGQAFIDAMGWIKDRFDGLSTWIKNNKETFEKIVEVLIDFGAGIVTVWAASKLISTVTNIFGGLKTALSFFTSPTGIIALIIAGLILLVTHWDEVKKWAVDAWEKIEEAWGKASAWFDTKVTQPMVKWFKQAWENIKGFFVGAWGSITALWVGLSNWFSVSVIEPVKKFFSDAWGTIVRWVSTAWSEIVRVWEDVSGWFDKNVLQPVVKFFSDAWGTIVRWVNTAWSEIVKVWEDVSEWFNTKVLQPLAKFFSDNFGWVFILVKGAWDLIVGAWTGAATWFNSSVIQPIVKFFSDNFGWILRLVRGAWDGIVTAWTGAAAWFDSTVIGPIRDAWDSAIATITGWWNDLLNLFGLGAKTEISIYETTYKSEVVTKTYTDSDGTTTTTETGSRGGDIDTPPPPKNIFQKIGDFLGFATGGVFPPNQPFLGVLGDQKSGRNIETPEKLLRQIFQQEVIGGFRPAPASSTSYDGSDRNIVQQAVEAVLDKLSVNLVVDGETWARGTIRHINNAQRMSGKLLLEM